MDSTDDFAKFNGNSDTLFRVGDPTIEMKPAKKHATVVTVNTSNFLFQNRAQRKISDIFQANF